MKFLFVHQNFPGQYLHIVRYLHEAGHEVKFVAQRRDKEIAGVPTLEYIPLPVSSGVQPYIADLEANMMNGLAVARLCEGLKRDGFTPDIIIGHTGWGELFFVKEVWPNVPLLGYFEFWYRPQNSDLDFDSEFPPTHDDAFRIRMRNTTNLVSLSAADWGHTPTRWQRDLYPAEYHDRITIVHEGIDTDVVHPDKGARLFLSGGLSLSCNDQVLTYSARNLEPYRGFHRFMRALPAVLERCPKLRVIIVGGNLVSYGRKPPTGANWRDYMLAEVGGRIDPKRVHFVGWLPYAQYLAVLRISSAHVYMTYPFVLSWGLLEAMAAGCAIIGSRTPPVEEVINGIDNGYLVDFFDTEALVDRICSVIEHPADTLRIRENARRTVVESYDLKSKCLPAQLALIRQITGVDPLARPRVRSRRPRAARSPTPAALVAE
jgi:glycosyltransferase involved in cell wall biosynthesis